MDQVLQFKLSVQRAGRVDNSLERVSAIIVEFSTRPNVTTALAVDARVILMDCVSIGKSIN